MSSEQKSHTRCERGRQLTFSVFVTFASVLLGTTAAARSAPSPVTAPFGQDALVEAQIKNQESQAKYYQTLAASKSDSLSPILPGLLGVLGVVIGAAMSFLGLKHQAKNQERLELGRWQRDAERQDLDRQQARSDQHRLEVRQAVADLAKRLAFAAQSLSWITWVARDDPEHFSRDLVEKHDHRINSLFADMVAAQVLLAALDPTYFHKTIPLARAVYDLDSRIATATVKPDLEKLAELKGEASRFADDLTETLLGLLAEVAPTTPPA
jgi:hypothetical protein